MITFSIEDETIASLLYLLILISSVIMIALVYLIVLMRQSNDKIHQELSKFLCQSLSNTSTEYRKGFGGMFYPSNLKVRDEDIFKIKEAFKKGANRNNKIHKVCRCGNIIGLLDECDCIETECKGVKGFAKGGIVKGNDLANV